MSTELGTPATATNQRLLSPRVEGFLVALRERLPLLQSDYGVQALWLYGSFVRGEEGPASDLDLLVEFDDRPLSLLKFIELEHRLSDWLSVPVDLVEKKTLKSVIGRYILKEIVAV